MNLFLNEGTFFNIHKIKVEDELILLPLQTLYNKNKLLSNFESNIFLLERSSLIEVNELLISISNSEIKTLFTDSVNRINKLISHLSEYTHVDEDYVMIKLNVDEFTILKDDPDELDLDQESIDFIHEVKEDIESQTQS